jgi:hypothetical protein
MFILTVHWDMRLLWAALTITAKFYILFLLAAMFPTNRGICFSWDGASGRFGTVAVGGPDAVEPKRALYDNQAPA